MLYACIYGGKYGKFMSPETVVRKFRHEYPISSRTFRRYMDKAKSHLKLVESGQGDAEPLPYFKPLRKEFIETIVNDVSLMTDPNPPKRKRCKTLKMK